MKFNTIFFLIALFAVSLVAMSDLQAQKTPAALDFEMKSIDGKNVSLSDYAGKVVLLVNTASKMEKNVTPMSCGRMTRNCCQLSTRKTT